MLAIKNKLYDNTAFDHVSTQMSSAGNNTQKHNMSSSVLQGADHVADVQHRYRTNSAAQQQKPGFSLKKGLPPRGASISENQKTRQSMLPKLGDSTTNTFSQNYKSFAGAGDPNSGYVDFTGDYRHRNMQPRTNMPYVKRMYNNQVFLEESMPFMYPDDARKNLQAIDVAHQIMSLPQGLGGGAASFRMSMTSPNGTSHLEQTYGEMGP